MSLCKVFDFSIFSHDSIVKYTRGQSWVDGWYSFWYVAINTQSFWNQAFGILFFCGSFSSFFRQRTTKASTINGNAWHEWKSTSSDLYCHMMGVRNSYSKWYRNNISFLCGNCFWIGCQYTCCVMLGYIFFRQIKMVCEKNRNKNIPTIHVQQGLMT